MTPKQKAKDLVLSFINVPDKALKKNSNAAWTDKIMAKKFAQTCVDEILISMPMYPVDPTMEFSLWEDRQESANKYWESVQEEIEKL